MNDIDVGYAFVILWSGFVFLILVLFFTILRLVMARYGKTSNDDQKEDQ